MYFSVVLLEWCKEAVGVPATVGARAAAIEFVVDFSFFSYFLTSSSMEVSSSSSSGGLTRWIGIFVPDAERSAGLGVPQVGKVFYNTFRKEAPLCS